MPDRTKNTEIPLSEHEYAAKLRDNVLSKREAIATQLMASLIYPSVHLADLEYIASVAERATDVLLETLKNSNN